MTSSVDSANYHNLSNSKENQGRVHVKDLKKYLGVSENLADDLINVEDIRMPGTCEWFSMKEFNIELTQMRQYTLVERKASSWQVCSRGLQ